MSSEPALPPAPALEAIDHVHVFVSDRAAAEAWYARVLGFRRMADLEFWAAGGGPLTIADDSHGIHLALFEKPALPCRSTIALRADAAAFLAWRAHLQRELERDVRLEDHAVAWSLYFTDPDGNPFEITTYEYHRVAVQLRNA